MKERFICEKCWNERGVKCELIVYNRLGKAECCPFTIYNVPIKADWKR